MYRRDPNSVAGVINVPRDTGAFTHSLLVIIKHSNPFAFLATHNPMRQSFRK
jgi:hypothetical protein